MVNPLNSSKIYFRAYFIVWVFVAAIHAVILILGGVQTLEGVVDSLIHNVFFAVIGLGIWYIVRFTKLDSSEILNTLITHLAAGILLVTVWVFSSQGLLVLAFAESGQYLEGLKETVWERSVVGMLFYIIIAINYYLIQYYEEYETQKLNESEMKRLLKETELNMLKTQINPHFIFNSLNSVGSLTITNPEKAHQMVINLSSFLRYTITPSTDRLISLKDELDAIKLYLDIEKTRFGDKLKVDISCDDCENLELPQLILQPLVENAIKYGVYESTADSEIKLNCQKSDGWLDVKIENDIQKGGVPRKGKGIGLRNVKSRMELMYERTDLVTITNDDDRFSINLKFPQQV